MENIIVIGQTEGGGTLLLINSKDDGKSEGVKCVCHELEIGPHMIDDLQKAIKFNAFEPFDGSVILESLLTPEEQEAIVAYLA